MRVLLGAVLVLAIGGAVGVGCGSDDGKTTSASLTQPAYLRTSTGPYETTVEGTATFIKTDAQGNPIPLTTGTGSTGGATPEPGTTEPDAGDEEGIRVPAVFTVRDGKLSPATVTVPPTLPIELRITSEDDEGSTVTFGSKPEVKVVVPRGETVVRRLPGQKAGTIDVEIDGQPRTPAIVVADDAGP